MLKNRPSLQRFGLGMRADWPEISDLVIDYDPQTLERRPVRKSAVLRYLEERNMRTAQRIVSAFPSHQDILDGAAIDRTLIRCHAELQRLSLEFRTGAQICRLLRPLLSLLRQTREGPLRVVDIGCGLGYAIRWLAACGGLGADVELLGCDYNSALVSAANRLAEEENLRCSFRSANALMLDQPADVFLSSGVLHHFRGDSLGDFLHAQRHACMLHVDVKASWVAPMGAWVFHYARMREPLSRHDGILSAVRAHPAEHLLASARRPDSPLRFALFDGHSDPLPILRTLNVLVGLPADLCQPYRAAVGGRLGDFA